MIIFEGMDRTGKSSLLKKVNELSDYKYLCVDRHIISYIAYCLKFNRPLNYSYLKSCISSKIFVVYLKPSDDLSKSILLDRLLESESESEHRFINVDTDSCIFDNAVEQFKMFCSLNKVKYLILTMDSCKLSLHSMAKAVIDTARTYF